MRNLKEYIIEGIFDIDNNEEKLDRNINIYKNAINIIKHHTFHPNTLTSFCMEMDSNSTDDDIINYLKQSEDSDYFDLFKVLYEISLDIDWYRTFSEALWSFDMDEYETYSICVPQKIYKKMSGQQYQLLLELGMSKMHDYEDIEEWILIRDKNFNDQHWVIYIKKDMQPIHKRVMRELIKCYEKRLKVKK